MGLRAALERMIIDKVTDLGNFRHNVDEFQKAGYLSLNQKKNLDSILDAGHAAIHRLWEPTQNDIDTLLDIAES
jgi:Domain of unknown function (DUF4145)